MAVTSWQTEGVAAITQVFHSILVATNFSEASRRAYGLLWQWTAIHEVPPCAPCPVLTVVG